jgi:hypothetical protein
MVACCPMLSDSACAALSASRTSKPAPVRMRDRRKRDGPLSSTLRIAIDTPQDPAQYYSLPAPPFPPDASRCGERRPASERAQLVHAVVDGGHRRKVRGEVKRERGVVPRNEMSDLVRRKKKTIIVCRRTMSDVDGTWGWRP